QGPPMRPMGGGPRFPPSAPYMPPPPVRHPADSQEEYYDPMNFFDVEAVRTRVPPKIGEILNRGENGGTLSHDDINLLRFCFKGLIKLRFYFRGWALLRPQIALNGLVFLG